MQRAYISKLLELAEKDSNILHVLADSGTGFDEMFRLNFPDQIYNFGISEEHMVAAAAGMACVGKIPFVYTAGAFLAYRALEFIRDDICFQNLNVKIIGMGSGLAWSTLGPTHHTTEDISVLRALPNLMLLSAATPRQVSACVEKAYKHQGPVYIRIGMNNEKEFYPEDYFLTSSHDLLLPGRDIALLTTGSILEEAAQAVQLLADRNISAALINIHTLKPVDEQALLADCGRFKMLFTVEEHNIYGGLGSILSELLSESGSPVKLHRIGLKDHFALGYGTHRQVRTANKLDGQGIYSRIMEVLE